MRTYKVDNIRGHTRYFHFTDDGVFMVGYNVDSERWEHKRWSQKAADEYLDEARTLSAYTVTEIDND